MRGVLLLEIAPDRITFAATSWKQGVLVWLWGTDQPYILRCASAPTPAPTGYDSRVEYHVTAPEPLPDNYRFDLIARFPVSKSYRLSEATNLDAVQYTQQDTTMNFWFTDLDVISVINGTDAAIWLPETDAAALDYPLTHGAHLSFVPDAE